MKGKLLLDRRNNCDFCKVNTIKKKNQHRYVDDGFQAWCPTGLKCSCCESPALICQLCIVAIVQKAEEKGDSIILSDPWIAALKLYVERINRGETTEDVGRNFQGNCCYSIGHEPTRTDVDVKCHSEEGSPMVYDGGLVLLGHGILIETNCDAVDVNAMGPDELAGIGKGIVHGVIDSSLARQLQMEGYAPKESDSNFTTRIHDIVIPSVVQAGQEKKLCVEVIVFERPDLQLVEGLGFALTRDDLNDVYGNIFSSPKRLDVAPDVTLLLVPSAVENVMTLANARWYGCLAHSMSDDDRHAMLLACRDLLKNDGFESRRKYSNGETTASAETLQAFKAKGAFPRSLPGVHFVQFQRKWAGIYISPIPGSNGKRVAIIYDYSQPRRGGQFEMDLSVFDQYSAFPDFTRRKVQTAFVCQELEKVLQIYISPNAVKTTISQVHRARKIMKEVERDEDVERDDEHVLLRVISAFNQYTMVEYPCSKHRDIYRKVNLQELYGDSAVLWHMTDAQSEKWGTLIDKRINEALEDDACVSTSSLENKFVIAINNPSRRKGISGTGRGGAGNNSYCVAFLDWANSNGSRSRGIRAAQP